MWVSGPPPAGSRATRTKLGFGRDGPEIRVVGSSARITRHSETVPPRGAFGLLSINARTQSEVPRRTKPEGSRKIRAGALSIGAFERGRWRLRRKRHLWVLNRFVFVYRLEVGALEAMSVVHEPRIWVAKERLGESEQAATAEV
jgi:hypothetical protein